MKTYSNTYADQICDILTPLVGKMMACSIIKTQAKKIGVTEETLSKQHLNPLSEGIAKGLNVFVGSEMSQKVTSTILSIR